MAIIIKDVRNYTKTHSLNKERELISRIRLGDVEGTRQICAELLAEIFNSGITNLQAIKVRVLEFVLAVSRAAVDGGADFNEVIHVNTKFIYDIEKFESIEEIFAGTHKIFKEYVKARTINKPQVGEIVSKVKKFIIQNYYRRLTLDEIAKSVFLSPYYVSHMFRESQGITVIEYLTRVRVEQARVLLRNSNYSINEISERIGYKEPGYFCKVFRRQEGRTPSQFRKLG